jgi:predicted enzyme related to lactoylglutathione lyase
VVHGVARLRSLLRTPAGVEPPQYAEWRLGDYQHELGLIDRKYSPAGSATGPGGVVVYWHVDDVAAMFEKLLSMGAKEYQPPTNREEGFITAAVTRSKHRTTFPTEGG